MSISVLEASCRPKDAGQPNLDRLVTTSDLVAVVDGATGKPWHGECLTGAEVADLIVDVLETRGAESSDPVRLVERMTREVARLKARRGASVTLGGAATVALVHGLSRTVVRIGDPWIRINDRVMPGRSEAETAVARARALLAHRALAAGMSVEELRRDDVARTGVMDLLKASDELRNHPTDPWAHAAIDGSAIPGRLIETWSLPEGVTEMVIASDGYPQIGPDLSGTESLLSRRLDRDPLMIEDPPATKPSPRPGASFDDRTFVKLSVGASG